MQAVETLNELYILAQIPGETEAFDFSVMEALFARGFTSREQVLDLPFPDFQQALTGTIAYDHATAIYANAGLPHVFPPPPAVRSCRSIPAVSPTAFRRWSSPHSAPSPTCTRC